MAQLTIIPRKFYYKNDEQSFKKREAKRNTRFNDVHSYYGLAVLKFT